MKSLEREGVPVAREAREPKDMSHEELVALVAVQAEEIRELREERQRLIEERAVAEEESRIDHLTGLKNRRAFDEDLPQSLGLGVRAGEPVSVALIDIDHFKSFNDTYGHAGGDAVLKEFGAFLKQSVRVTDQVARYGGEEFALILMGADEAEATTVLDKIRARLAEKEFSLSGAPVRITMSAGVASSASAGEAMELCTNADAALYRAKAAGRNRVIAYTE